MDIFSCRHLPTPLILKIVSLGFAESTACIMHKVCLTTLGALSQYDIIVSTCLTPVPVLHTV